MPRPAPSHRLQLAALSIFAAVGCHRPVQPLEPGQTPWETSRATADPVLDGWLEGRGAQARPVASSADTERTPLEAPAVRRLVLERHPLVLAARAELERAEAHAKAAGAWSNPELEGRALLGGSEAGSIEAALMLQLPISGRLAAARKAARLELEIARVQLDGAQRDALIEIDELLAQLDHQRRYAALATELARTSSQLATMVQQRQTASLADPLEVALTLAEAARDTGHAARAEADLHAVEGQLRALMGLGPDARILPPTLVQLSLDESREALLEAAAAHRHPWRTARLELEAAEWAAREASRARIPEPSLGPVVVGAPESPAIGVAVGLPIPVLAPGFAPYREALAARDAAHQRSVAAAREARREIDALLTRIQGLEAALAALEGSTLDAARQAARLARERYHASQLDLLHLQSAQRAWAGTETETLDLLLALRAAQLELERAVGRPLRLSPLPPETP
jgi:outer membrane protein TolC